MAEAPMRLTWIGHGTFLLETPGGRRLLLDAWVEHNPAAPQAAKARVAERLDAILITHAHGDHIQDALSLARATGARVVAIFETAAWLRAKGLPDAQVVDGNHGGTVDLGGVRATMVPAVHSCGILDGETMVYGGEAAGYVLTLEDGRRLYHAGDTMVFGDMRLIGELWRPEIAVLPIGGHYTMDPEQAAYAAGLLGVRTVVPGHFGTFPLLAGTPEALRHALAARGLGVAVHALRPGETASL